MNNISKEEVYGRSSLWLAAISECKTLLTLSKRSHERSVEISTKYNGFPPKNEPFPSLVECIKMSEYNTMLAVIFFAQAFNSGYKDEGAAAQNTKKFIEQHLPEVLKNTFNSESKIEEFSKFKDEILTVRNQMIAHADAPSFDIKHEDNGFLTQKMHMNAIKDIDIVYWLEIIDPLWSATLKHMSEFQPEQA